MKTCIFKVIRVNWNQALYTSPGKNVREDRTSSDRSFTIILPEQLSPKVCCDYPRSEYHSGNDNPGENVP